MRKKKSKLRAQLRTLSISEAADNDSPGSDNTPENVEFETPRSDKGKATVPNLERKANTNGSSSLSHLTFKERTYADALKSPQPNKVYEASSSSNRSEEVLESLFAQSGGLDPECDTRWSSLARKIKSFRDTSQRPAVETTRGAPSFKCSYKSCRQTAERYWKSSKTYHKQAADAHAAGKYQLASNLSKLGRSCREKALQEAAIASQQMFYWRNHSFRNTITIDLHGQLVEEGMMLLRMHLLFGTCLKSVLRFRIITGHGKHSDGTSVLKNEVIKLLNEENIHWTLENEGAIFIELKYDQELNFWR